MKSKKFVTSTFDLLKKYHQLNRHLEFNKRFNITHFPLSHPNIPICIHTFQPHLKLTLRRDADDDGKIDEMTNLH